LRSNGPAYCTSARMKVIRLSRDYAAIA